MMTFLLYLALMAAGATLAGTIAIWASRGSPARRNLIGILLAAVASYSAGFAADMLIAAIAGEIPKANVIAPVFTWLAIALVTITAAVTTRARSLVLALPFAANAAVAVIAALARPRHAIVALFLCLLAVATAAVRSASSRTPPKSYRQQGLANDEGILRTCNFQLARSELADFFRIANQSAASEGQQVAYREEFVRGWERFATNPNAETARAWLAEAPAYRPLILDYFQACCPGGRFALYESFLDRRSR